MYNSYRRVIRLETGEEISIDQPQSYAEAIGSLLNAHIVNEFYVREVLGAIEFVKTVNGKQLTVQVNLVTGCPIGAVLNFHSTCVMNIITYNTAYCLYPRATIDRHRSLLLRLPTNDTQRELDKYTSRGWKIVRKLNKPVSCFKHTIVRWIGDKYTWAVRLGGPVTPLEVSPYLDPISVTTWALLYAPASFTRMMQEGLGNEYRVYPLVAPKALIEDKLRMLLLQNADELRRVEMEESVIGYDRQSQIVISRLLEYLRSGEYLGLDEDADDLDEAENND
ncbi:hypothetical protein BC629DRAFT_1593441 [Irpex lacteus]|nr:hypothetical protein BC629DRAFT_1593441 [Irpex lacteus]